MGSILEMLKENSKFKVIKNKSDIQQFFIFCLHCNLCFFPRTIV